jgi:hypothetical protein
MFFWFIRPGSKKCEGKSVWRRLFFVLARLKQIASNQQPVANGEIPVPWQSGDIVIEYGK